MLEMSQFEEKIIAPSLINEKESIDNFNNSTEDDRSSILNFDISSLQNISIGTHGSRSL